MDNRTIIMSFTEPPSLEDIEALAKSIIDALPDGLDKYIGRLKVAVEDFPDAYTEQELELETPFDILGFYESAGPAAIGHLAAKKDRRDTLHLFRRPLLDLWCESGEELTTVVNRVILQEIGHHFGFSEDEIEMYEEDMQDVSPEFDLTA